MRRRGFVVRATAAALWPLAGRAQQKAVLVVGWLHSLSADRSAAVVTAFDEGLREAGYSVGKNVDIEYGGPKDTMNGPPALADELLRRKVDVIFKSGGFRAALAAKQKTNAVSDCL